MLRAISIVHLSGTKRFPNYAQAVQDNNNTCDITNKHYQPGIDWTSRHPKQVNDELLHGRIGRCVGEGDNQQLAWTEIGEIALPMNKPSDNQ